MATNRAAWHPARVAALLTGERQADNAPRHDRDSPVIQARLRRARWLAVVAGTAAVAGAVVLVELAPWVFGFTLAVGAAGAWCAWLERHPED